MLEKIWIGDPPLEVRIRRVSRARKFTLRLSGKDGHAHLTMPLSASQKQAVAFARNHAGWLHDRLAAQPPVIKVEIGAIVPFQGHPHKIVGTGGQRVLVDRDTIAVPGAAPQIASRLRGFFKETARGSLAAASAKYAARLDVDVNRLTLRDTSSRWGSCAPGGRLMFSWRLVLAPSAVLDYVAAHEVAHLRELNHSGAYWKIVAEICPEFEAHRRWLKNHGAELHRVDFE